MTTMSNSSPDKWNWRMLLQTLSASLLFCSGCEQSQIDPSPRLEQSIINENPPLHSRPVPEIASPPSITSDTPLFVRVDQAWQIEFERYDDQKGLHRILEVNGGGVAMADFDHDGDLEILFTDGCQLPLKAGDQHHRTRLFQRGASWNESSHLARLDQFGFSTGCATGDVNNDGFEDLYIAAYGPNTMWLNNGDGTFSASENGLQCGAWSTSAAFGDFNRDGALDLYVALYVKYSDENPRLCPNPDLPGQYVQCSPTLFDAEDDKLFLSNGDGTFQEVSTGSGATGVDGKGLGVVVFDSNDDDWPDIYVANDGVPNFLFINESGGDAFDITDSGKAQPVRFTNRAFELGAAVSYTGESEASMGVTVGDVDGNGTPEVFLTNFYLEKNTLYANQGRNGFRDTSNESGLANPSRPMLGFGTEFIDVNNDGALDLFVANGHIDDFSWDARKTPYAMHPQLFSNNGRGHFDDVSAKCGDYFNGKWIGRGMACGDLNRDGRIDVVVSHQRSRSAVLLNDSRLDNAAVMLRLIGKDQSNRSAIGARVRAKVAGQIIHRFVVGGGSFQSASARDVHIGVTQTETLESASIRWPSGLVQDLGSLPAGALYSVIEGQEPVLITAFDRR